MPRKSTLLHTFAFRDRASVLEAEQLFGGFAVQGNSTIRWLASQSAPSGASHRPATDREDTGIAGRLLRKVLVVDDEEDLAHMAEMLLSNEGLDVVVANSALRALEILEQDRDIDAVFSDVMMPGMNGLQLADAVREMYPRVKIVLTSGYTLPSLLADRKTHYLFAPKPYRIDTVLKLLRS